MTTANAIRTLDNLKIDGQFYEAGRFAFDQGMVGYGCHIGMRSTRDYAIAEFNRGVEAAAREAREARQDRKSAKVEELTVLIHEARKQGDWDRVERLHDLRRDAEVDADEAMLDADEDELVQVKRSDLEMLQGLIGGFHAVKQIRAHAAEENADTKRAALAMLKVLLATPGEPDAPATQAYGRGGELY